MFLVVVDCDWIPSTFFCLRVVEPSHFRNHVFPPRGLRPRTVKNPIKILGSGFQKCNYTSSFFIEGSKLLYEGFLGISSPRCIPPQFLCLRVLGPSQFLYKVFTPRGLRPLGQNGFGTRPVLVHFRSSFFIYFLARPPVSLLGFLL